MGHAQAERPEIPRPIHALPPDRGTFRRAQRQLVLAGVPALQAQIAEIHAARLRADLTLLDHDNLGSTIYQKLCEALMKGAFKPNDRLKIRDLAERLAAMAPDDPKAAERAKALVVTAAYMAFAEGLIGDILTPMLGAPEGLGRDLALKLTATLLAEP